MSKNLNEKPSLSVIQLKKLSKLNHFNYNKKNLEEKKRQK
jgi:hypothetical protein